MGTSSRDFRFKRLALTRSVGIFCLELSAYNQLVRSFSLISPIPGEQMFYIPSTLLLVVVCAVSRSSKGTGKSTKSDGPSFTLCSHILLPVS